MRARKSAGRTAGSRSFSKVSFGCRLETTARAASFSPLSVTTPTARPFSIRISLHCAVRANVDVAHRAGARDRLRNRAHAADRVAPDALFAVHLAPAMMQKHVARAGRIGAVVSSDDSVEAEDRLDRIALEPLVENIAGRAGEELEADRAALRGRANAGGFRPWPRRRGRRDWRRAPVPSADWAASPARARAARRSGARAAPRRRRAASASRAENLATSAFVRPGPTLRYAPVG